MSGKSDEIKGRVKKAVGELTGNNRLKREGEIDKVAGKVKQGMDKVKDALQGKKTK
ncbi:MAG: CsbD family protein [Pirellulaceae bacterium]|nr:CsbD family protein [Pirellulaceae bacterium]